MEIRAVQAVLVQRRALVNVELLLTSRGCLHHVLKTLISHTLPIHLLSLAALTLR